MLTQAMPPVSILSESQSSVITPGSATSTPSTPNHTPPGTPTTPTTPFLPSPTPSGASTSGISSTSQSSSLASKPKSKKRKLKVRIYERVRLIVGRGCFWPSQKSTSCPFLSRPPQHSHPVFPPIIKIKSFLNTISEYFPLLAYLILTKDYSGWQMVNSGLCEMARVAFLTARPKSILRDIFAKNRDYRTTQKMRLRDP